ncbi:hypothetical protein YC2023_081374 [Brassica napus]
MNQTETVNSIRREIRSGERFVPVRDSTTSAISPARFDYSDDVDVRRDLIIPTTLTSDEIWRRLQA